MKDKRPGARIYQCLAECCVTKTQVAVDISQNRTKKHLPIVCDKTNNGELCQMLRPFPEVPHICNTLDARLNGNDNPDNGNLSQRRATTHGHLIKWESQGQVVNPHHLLKMVNFSMKTLRLMGMNRFH